MKFVDNVSLFAYKKNNLYYFLNKEDNPMGNMILGRYEYVKEVDYMRLREQAICMKLIENKNYV